MIIEKNTNAEFNEHKAWLDICNKLQEILKIDKDTFNNRTDILDLAILIEKWGYAEHMRRLRQNDNNNRGIFYNDN